MISVGTRAVAAVHRIADLDRGTVRTAFERRFTVERMATDYLDIYRRLAAPRPAGRPFSQERPSRYSSAE